jgi:S-adenosylmethionine synthetase
MQTDLVFSSESVTAGHPDKLCDQISDAVVDRYLQQDPRARVAAECAISTGILFVSIKARSRAMVDAPAVARELLEDVGYVADGGFDPRTCTVMTSLHPLPEDRFQPVDEEQLEADAFERVTVRDQATLFGFACKDTPNFMPLPIWLAHRLARRLANVRGELEYLSPDGKTQVAIEYRDRKPTRIHGITLIACQRERAWPSASRLENDLRERVIEPVCADLPVRCDAKTRIATNPDGPLVPGGPALHAGLTGRKTAVDAYGEFARGGATAFSGKDPSRIDRVGRYAAHHAARNVVASGLAERCEIQLSYSIGLSRPVSVVVDTYGTSRVPESEIAERVLRVFDFRPAAIIKRFGLRSLPTRHTGIYRKLAVYGQVGRDDLDAPWERLDCTHLLD